MTTLQEQQYSDLLALSGRSGGSFGELMIAASERVTGWTPGTLDEGYIRLLQALTSSTQTSLPGLQARYADMLQTEPSGIVFPTWARDFTQRLSLTSDITFTRASAAYYTNSDGTLTSFASGEARLGDRGLLLEEARTNLIRYSHGLDNATYWTKAAGSITADATTARDGTTTADLFTEDNATAIHGVYQGVSGGGANDTAYAWSFDVKPNGRTWMRVGVLDKDNSFKFSWINLSTLTPGTEYSGHTISAEAKSDGWIRVTLLFTSAATGSANIIAYAQLSTGNNIVSYAGDGASGAYLTKFQFEAGAFASSPIDTPSSATVTRAADVATVTGIDSASWFNASEGTLYAEYSPLHTGTQYLVSLNNATANNAISLGMQAGSNRQQVQAGGASSAIFDTSGAAAGTIYKSALAYRPDDFAGSLNGAAVQQDTSGAVPAGATQLEIGEITGVLPMSGHIRRIAYYPRRLPNAQLQALTS